MLTLGDVFSVVAFLSAIAFCSWSLLVAASLVMDRRVRYAHEAVKAKPWKCLGVGLVWLIVVGGIGFALAAAPNPLTKVAGIGIIVGLLGITAVGLAGLASVAGARMQELDPAMSEYAAVSRGALFVTLPGFLPILGWFGIAPVLIVLGLGAGVKGVFRREARVVVVPEAV